MLIGVDFKAQAVPFTFNGRMREESHSAYRERHINNPWTDYMVQVPVGALVQSSEILALDDLKRTVFFDEVLRPQDMAHNLMMSVARRKDFHAAFNMCRSERQGLLEADGLHLIHRLYPHLRRSLLLAFRLDGYRALQQAKFDVLDRLAAGVVLLDRQARIVYANATARSYDSGALRLRNGSIGTHSVAHTRRLGKLIQAALLGAPVAAMSVPRAADARLVTILVLSVRGKDIGRFAELNMPDAAVLLFLFDPANRTGLSIPRIMDAYRLTQAEARVALAAGSGMSVPEAATQLGLSPNTIKTHLRKVFAKTGTGRQAELAFLLAQIGQIVTPRAG